MTPLNLRDTIDSLKNKRIELTNQLQLIESTIDLLTRLISRNGESELPYQNHNITKTAVGRGGKYRNRHVKCPSCTREWTGKWAFQGALAHLRRSHDDVWRKGVRPHMEVTNASA